ncbi:MAG: zf-HC2 domain-containing protein [Vicinamibacterales bacterium]
MRTTFTCDDRETLVAYLYGELDAGPRAAVAAHVESCAACAAEVAALGGVRRLLGEWTPPAPPLRFTVAPDVPATVLRPAVSRWQRVPAWAQVVAATLTLAVGAAIANVQVRRDASGWTMTTGWMAPAAAPAAAASAPATAGDAEAWRPALVALEQSLRRELADGRRADRAEAVAAPVADAQALARVRTLIQDSERRQQQELALRLAQFSRDLDLQRRADLVRIDQGFGRLEGRTGAEVARQREMLNYIVRTGLRPPQ